MDFLQCYVLVGDDKSTQLDQTYAFSLEQACIYFFIDQEWVIGEVLTLEQYQMELQLNDYESQHM